ncbi:MAG: alpha/beta hydrolase [Bacteroidota bacterium]
MKKCSIFFSLCLLLLQLQAQSTRSFKVEVTGKGQPVILIPGYSCSGDVWKETVEHLKDRYQCHVLTLAGYAGVPAIPSPILETIKNDVIVYVKEHQLKKPILIGHSLGAFMSIWVSSEAPNLFGKMICVDGLPFLSALNNPAANADSLKVDPRFNTDAVIKSFESLPDSGFIDRTAKVMLYQVNDSVRAREIATWQYNSNRRSLGLTLVELSTTDLRPALKKISEPMLVLGSIYANKENSYKLIGAQYANAKQVIIHVADSKHFIMYDQPQWLYNEIDAFLKP